MSMRRPWRLRAGRACGCRADQCRRRRGDRTAVIRIDDESASKLVLALARSNPRWTAGSVVATQRAFGIDRRPYDAG
ncbi:hypothetical protein WT60_12920 [Burkholderia sp. MSMB617WGS]|uniref:Uncharacterized protein n=1 Tax=Burkholderia savannae TaxID=1637837 RepID=A0ABR5TFD6_9BURK|nr:hypothetical protein WT60_12920 [Burkholderia sp. MSMB617WGS]KWZ41209.1 hypothetical protein WS73_28575 [Burkholderia savannae]KWZ43653.1 hypothetical protein WS72_12840 [Burkholderia savannae]